MGRGGLGRREWGWVGEEGPVQIVSRRTFLLAVLISDSETHHEQYLNRDCHCLMHVSDPLFLSP